MIKPLVQMVQEILCFLFVPFLALEVFLIFVLLPNITEGRSEGNDSNSKFDLGVPDDLDVSIELRNWLFALEGTEEVGDWSSPRSGDHISREDKCWHTTFRNLHVSGKSNDRPNLGGAEKVLDKRAFPVERFTVIFVTAVNLYFNLVFSFSGSN
jgi:hypothetical protein